MASSSKSGKSGKQGRNKGMTSKSVPSKSVTPKEGGPANATLPLGAKALANLRAAETKPANSPSKLKVALLGFGTVGRSVAKILSQAQSGPVTLTHIFNRNVEKKRANDLPPNIVWTDNIDQVLSSDVDVIVEVVGGINPPGEWIRKALRTGKSVVTANKLLIAESGAELLALAKQMGQRLEFGASVAGGIPAIIAIQEGLAGDRLFKIAGILNGTCNYILTRMESTGASFAAALKEAQELGYAEADPRGDVDGYDARAKLVILIQAGLGLSVRSEQIPCWPISAVEAVDFLYARELNCTDPADFAGGKRAGEWLELDCCRQAGAGSAVLVSGARAGKPEYRDGYR